MRFWEKVRKNLLLALALMMALSSFGGAPALAWVHADGSLCFTCPLEESAPASAEQTPVAAPVDDCCPSVTSEAVETEAVETEAEAQAAVSPLDCQICCEAEGHEQSHRQVLQSAVATLSTPPTMAQVFRVQISTLPTQRNLARKTVPYALPSLRAPPV